MIKIDGSKGEGGGQILRTSLSLSAITGKEIVIEKIRAGREKPGLKRQHLTCVKAVAEICSAEVSTVEVGASSLEFKPGQIKGGDYHFNIGTAGSVTLVAQTIIPILLMAKTPSRVTITGGTHVSFAPTWDFFSECYLPEIRRMGANVEASLESYGFSPAGGGKITLSITPFDNSSRNKNYFLIELGEFKGGIITGVVSDIKRKIAETEVEIVFRRLSDLILGKEIQEVESVGPGNYCIAKLQYERASVVFSSIGCIGRSRKTVANEIVHAVQKFLKSNKACEVHLADQLLLPYCVFVLGEINYFNPNELEWLSIQEKSLHFTTNMDVICLFK